MKILHAVPSGDYHWTNGAVRAFAFLPHTAPPGSTVIQHIGFGYYDRARNDIMSIAYHNDFDFVLMMDSDIGIIGGPPMILSHLISQAQKYQADIIGAPYVERIEADGRATISIFKWVDASDKSKLYTHCFEKDWPDTDDMVVVDGVAAGLLFLTKKVIHALLDPKTVKKFGLPFDFGSSSAMGEDLAFCYRASRRGFKMYCDPSIKLVHTKPGGLIHRP